MLNKIHLQSVDVLLYNCRSQMEMFKVSPPHVDGQWRLMRRTCYLRVSFNVGLVSWTLDIGERH